MKARKSLGVEETPGVDAILRKMAKREVSELQVSHIAAVNEKQRDDDTMQRLLQSNFLKAARMHFSRNARTGAGSH